MAPIFERKKRLKFENGKVVEYWVDVPIVEKQEEGMYKCIAILSTRADKG